MYEPFISQYLDKHRYEAIRLKAVLFDMDGVLFDSMKNHATAWHEAMKRYGMSMTREEAYMHEGRTGASTINIVSLRERGHEATEAEIKEIYHTKSEIFTALAKPERMEGAYELLLKVKQAGLIPMVVTGSGQKSLLDKLNHYFPDIFRPELMVTAFDVKYGKPNPEPYLMALKKADVRANEIRVDEEPGNDWAIEDDALASADVAESDSEQKRFIPQEQPLFPEYVTPQSALPEEERVASDEASVFSGEASNEVRESEEAASEETIPTGKRMQIIEQTLF